MPPPGHHLQRLNELRAKDYKQWDEDQIGAPTLNVKSHNIPISTKVKIEYTVWSHEESTRLFNFTKIDYEQVEKECVGSYAIKKTGNDSLDIIEASLTMPPIAP